jgi:hypothetical protein
MEGSRRLAWISVVSFPSVRLRLLSHALPPRLGNADKASTDISRIGEKDKPRSNERLKSVDKAPVRLGLHSYHKPCSRTSVFSRPHVDPCVHRTRKLLRMRIRLQLLFLRIQRDED